MAKIFAAHLFNYTDNIRRQQEAGGVVETEALTCDLLVTYCSDVDDDACSKALADPTRRFPLDLLYEQDGRTLTALESELADDRFGAVTKHLRILERAGSSSRAGGLTVRRHYLNAVPIQMIHNPMDEQLPRAPALAPTDLGDATGDNRMSANAQTSVTQVYEVYIKATLKRSGMPSPHQRDHAIRVCRTGRAHLRPGGAFRTMSWTPWG
ncbi:MAG: hypothetical protein U0Q11_24120 [Vicinamibacterales bacterium]